MKTQILEEILSGEGMGLVTLTVEQYHQIIEAGILGGDSHVELLDGLLVLKDRRDRGKLMNVGPRHATTVTRLLRAVQDVAETAYTHVRCQQPISLRPNNEPEPDVSVILGKPVEYRDCHPGIVESVAVMEVADLSLRRDREIKQRIYADAGIACYWIVNMSANQIEVYTQPQPGDGRFAQMQTVSRGGVVPLRLFEENTVSVQANDILV